MEVIISFITDNLLVEHVGNFRAWVGQASMGLVLKRLQGIIC